MLTIEDLIKQSEARLALHEQVKRYFEDGTMAVYHNYKEVPREESIAKEEGYIVQEQNLITSLREIQKRLHE